MNGSSFLLLLQVMLMLRNINAVVITEDPITCINDITFIQDGWTCQSVRNKENRRKKYCQREEFHNACPVSCGVCCSDDATYTFENDNKVTQDCEWIGGKADRKDKFCNQYRNGRMVREDACPMSCDYCDEYVSVSVVSSAADSTD